MWIGVNYKRYWISEKMNGSTHMQQSTEHTTAAWGSIWDIRNIAAIAGRYKCDDGSVENWNVIQIYHCQDVIFGKQYFLIIGITIIRMEATNINQQNISWWTNLDNMSSFMILVVLLAWWCLFSPQADSCLGYQKWLLVRVVIVNLW